MRIVSLNAGKNQGDCPRRLRLMRDGRAARFKPRRHGDRLLGSGLDTPDPEGGFPKDHAAVGLDLTPGS